MLKNLISFSLKHSALVLLSAVGLLIYAGLQLRKMPVDVFPELNAPTVVVLTEAGGLAADEVEQFVTFPIETAVNGLPGVRRVRSASAISLSLVWVEFDWGTDIYRARQLATERLAAVRENLPENAHAEITPITSITGEIMLLSVSSPDGSVSDLDLRAYAEFDLRNKLLAVPGVAQVSAIGGELPEYQINVRQERLALYGLTMEDVVAAARAAHSNASAGYLADVERQELPIRQSARVRSVRDIAATIVTTHEGAPVTLGEVADVTLGGAPRRGSAAAQGRPAVVLTIQKSPNTNTLALTAQVDKTLDQVEKALPPGIAIGRDAFRQSRFIERSVNNVVVVLRDATIIVAVILILFLLNVRTTIITLTALPLSLAAALLAMHWMGLTLNVMTLGGLAVAVGVLVDDAIIDVENVFRRLKENAALPPDQRREKSAVIFDASNEIRPSMVFATVIIVIVFIPLLFLEGLEGRFFAPLGLTYIISILASLIIALTVTPALCKLLLRATPGKKEAAPATITVHNSAPSSHHADGFLVRVLKRRYEPALLWSLRHKPLVLTTAFIATALAALLASTFGTSFLPEFKEGSFTVFVSSPPGTSLAESERSARGIEQRLMTVEGVRSVTRRTGRAERDEHAEPVSSSEIEVSLTEKASYATVREALASIAASVPGLTVQIGQPIEHRLSHILSGTPAAIAINVYGEDLATLRRLAKEIETELKSLPGARDVTANREVLITSLPIIYRHADLAAVGLTPADAAEQVQMALYGETVAQVNDGPRRVDIVVRLAAEDRRSVEQLESLILQGRDGALVRLSEVADIGLERTSNIIARENSQRKAVISCNVAPGHNLGDLVASVRHKVEPIVQRAGYIVEFGGQFEAQQSASRTLLLAGGGIALVMLLLLQLSTGSVKVAILVTVNLPLAIIGGVVAIFIADSLLHAHGGGPRGLWTNTLALFRLGSASYQAPVLSIASLVGFITLFGIAVRNGILLVNHFQHVSQHEKKPLHEAIVQGSLERLVPILMTALCAALGLLPLALAAGRPGSELLAPLAIVVLGGLLTSTFLNLFVVPVGYELVQSWDADQSSLVTRLSRAWKLPRSTRVKEKPSTG